MVVMVSYPDWPLTGVPLDADSIESQLTNTVWANTLTVLGV